MKIKKAAFVSSLGLSIIHFGLVIIGMRFRPDVLSSGNAGMIADNVQSVLTQPGLWVADFMGCIFEKPMWWIFLILNSILWGNVIAFLIRIISKAFVKDGKSN